MIGMVLGSVGTPFWPWHAAHACAFASMSSAAHAGKTASAKPTPTPKIAEKRPANIVTFLPTPDGARRAVEASIRGKAHTLGLSSNRSSKYSAEAHGLGLLHQPSGVRIPHPSMVTE